ncbi:DNA-dependent ATPase RDH54 Ecym_2678 [Eremothecium cymbalariae DBVPG|uniref:DNA repair and recombination protein RDH54 n=1 Tax=Eremothecium cymbalariae (strain CBS 270.75 / DBVPG 7215 / KCTC 17166 / NRRL Y-17582) TaxID=931890 RepID=G8JNW3_ERECY|nr:Hypothetical protein Ecym_2678 [Eremothecium cymbalariae DBVPG\
MSYRSSLQSYQNKPFKAPKMAGKLSSQCEVDNISSQGQDAKYVVPITISETNAKSEVEQTKKRKLNARLYMITFRKSSTKKNKTWDGDGYGLISASEEHITLYNEGGKRLGTHPWYLNKDMSDLILKCGSGWECQLDYEITDTKEYADTLRLLKPQGSISDSDKEGLHIARRNPTAFPSLSGPKDANVPTRVPISKLFTPTIETKFRSVLKQSESTAALTSNSSLRNGDKTYQALFDKTKIENPLVMNRAVDDEVEIIVDPLLSKTLRPHQRIGVKFMYDCIRGLSRPENDDVQKDITLEYDGDIKGCLLADEMGLGKTYMTITLIWTLLKQHPKPSNVPCSQSGVALQGMCHKILVVCPVTLIGNWKKEFTKWLPLNKIGVLTLSNKNTPEKDKSDVRNFLRVQRTYHVLILGYEKLLAVVSELEQGKNKLGLLVCDEGHRLKNANSKILKCLTDLDIDRKVILTGTPIQNDLNEFYTIINFINPGILGSFSCFKRTYINPITRARDVNNRFSEKIQSLGESKSQDLIEITKRFTLRRTSSIIANYLPPKTDLVIFCKPTVHQIETFKMLLLAGQIDFQRLQTSSSLGLITLFKKVCNSPSLISSDPYYQNTIQNHGKFAKLVNSIDSGKLKVLMSLLSHIRNNTDGEKVVIVSNYTQTLDIIQGLMASSSLSFVRLDGSTPAKERDSIVSLFNSSPNVFGFLLSAKSGGVGLNLIGASRLILFDNDWNPSVDLQAMSRIHRDGQKRPCFIYRLVTTGCIDEKIFQRQLMKNNLSKKFLDNHLDEKTNDNLFEKEDLKDLFTIQTATKCNTHDLICSCPGLGHQFEEKDLCKPHSADKESTSEVNTDGWMCASDFKDMVEEHQKEASALKNELMRKCLVGYRHINPELIADLRDPIIERTLVDLPNVMTFAFVCSSIE